MGVATPMAKRKTTPQQPAAEPIRKNVISIRGTESWRDWLIGYAEFRRVPVTSLIDQVLTEAAKRDGYTAPPVR